MEKIVLIDGNSIVNRAYFGLPDLTTSKGQHTNGIIGFLNIMLRLLDEEKPDYLAIAFDVHEPTFRHTAFADYKAQRKPMDEALYSQFPLLHNLLKAMGIFIIEKGGYEADDLLGTMAKFAESKGVAVSLVSGDKDLLQLANDIIKVRIPTTVKGKTTIKDYNNEEFVTDFGLDYPAQIIDLKAIMGDSSDNYKGVEGIGKVGATKLIKEYGTLDGVYANLDKITGSNHDKLEKGKEDAYFCKWLATIKTDCDIDFDLSYARLGNIFTSEAYNIIKELEFKSLLGRFEKREVVTQNSDDENKVVKDSFTPALTLITELGAAQEAFDKMKATKDKYIGMSYAAYDIDDGFSKEFCAIALECGDLNYVFIIEGFITEDYVLSNILDLCGDERVLSGFELKCISEKLKMPVEQLFDLTIASYLLYPGKNSYTEADVARDILGLTVPEEKEILGKQSVVDALLEPDMTGEARRKASELLMTYAHVAALSCAETKAVLKNEGMYDLFMKVEMPLMKVLRDMEIAGIIVDRDALVAYGSYLTTEIKKLEAAIYKICGEEFNINSPKQLGEILFEKIKLPGGKKTKSGYSTAAEVLEKLKSEDPVIELILKYRELTKLKGTYAEGMGSYICADGRIHTKFNQTVTATGRLSSTDPNLQNIPIRKELGREIRKMFIPKSDCCFIDADYSQIELRLLAHMSGDESLITAYSSGEDIHRITAAKVFGVEPSEVTPLMRSNAKAVNFGIIYGMSSFGLGQEINVSRKDAEEYIKHYFETYPTIKNYLDSLVEGAKKNGWVKTLYGRKRPVPDINSSNFMVRSGAERIAMNSPIQGTAADIMKIALVNVAKRLEAEKLKTRILLQVHDELLLEVPLDEKDRVITLVKEEMTNAADLKVKLEVSAAVGDNWDAAH